MIDFIIDESEETGILKIDGALTIDEVETFKTAVQMAIGRVKKVIIDLENMTEISLACLQLLCSAHKTASRDNKCIVLWEKIPKAFKNTAFEAGLLRHNNCTEGRFDKCFWI